jgi:ATP-binding cassette subfamily B protein
LKHPLGTYWRLLRRYLDQQRGAVLLMGLLLLASIALQLAGPQIVRGFIDAAQSGAGEGVLIRAALVFIGVSVAQQLLGALARYWSARVAWTATNELRADLSTHLVQLDLGFHTAHTPGELIERVDGDVNALSGFFSSFAVQLAGSVLLLAGVLTVVFRANAPFGIALTAFAIFAVAGLGWARRFAIPLLKVSREHSAAFYGYVGELIAATEDIRSSGATAYALRRFFERLRGWLPVQFRAQVRESVVWMTAVGIFAIGDAIAYGFGGGLYRLGAISLGTVYMIVAYAAMLAEPIETIRTELQNLQHADAGIARVRELLETRSRLEDGQALVPVGALSVEFDHVSFGYDDQAVSSQQPVFSSQDTAGLILDDISFSLAPGRVLGLLGHTGSGKTTLARLLFRLYDPQWGEVRLGGVDLRQARIDALRARVGLVTQDVQLFEATLRDNITFFDTTIADVRALAALERLGLTPWLDRLPDGLDTIISGTSLSAGEAQLLALARVLKSLA